MQPSNLEIDRWIYLLEGRIMERLSPEEADELEDWRNGSIRNLAFLDEYDSVEQVLEILQNRKKIDTEAALHRVQIQTGQVEENIRVIGIQWWKYAAAAALFISLSYWYVKKKPIEETVSQSVVSEINPAANKAILTVSDGHKINLDEAKTGVVVKQNGIKVFKTGDGQLVYEADHSSVTMEVSGYNSIATPKGGQYQVNLPDGTKVWLNALSSIRFPVVFSSNNRRVETTGEAYFEVAKSRLSDHGLAAFRVISKGQVIEVTGTHFNVNAYADEGAVTTTLLEGSVNVSQTRGDRLPKVRLTPGEQSIVGGEQAIGIRRIDPELAIAWKQGYFRYSKTDVSEIMRQMSRWYDIDVHYEDETTPNARFTGFVSRSLTLSNALKMLEEGGGVKFRIEGKKVFVKTIE